MKRHVLAVVAAGVLLTGALTGCAGVFGPAVGFGPPRQAVPFHPSPREIRVLRKQEAALEAHVKAQAEARLRAVRRAERERPARGSQIVPLLGTGAGHPRAATIALQYLGVPYVWGGSTPHGFDSSGLVMYVYSKLGIKLPHYTVSQWNMTAPISRAKMKRGDLVF